MIDIRSVTGTFLIVTGSCWLTPLPSWSFSQPTGTPTQSTKTKSARHRPPPCSCAFSCSAWPSRASSTSRCTYPQFLSSGAPYSSFSSSFSCAASSKTGSSTLMRTSRWPWGSKRATRSDSCRKSHPSRASLSFGSSSRHRFWTPKSLMHWFLF